MPGIWAVRPIAAIAPGVGIAELVVEFRQEFIHFKPLRLMGAVARSGFLHLGLASLLCAWAS